MKVKGAYLVGLFLLILILGFCSEAKAEVTIEAGPTFLSGELSDGAVIQWSERFGGPYGSRYAYGMGYISEQKVLPTWERNNGLPKIEVRENLYIFAQRRVNLVFMDKIAGCPTWDCFSLGIGAAYMNARTRWNGTHFVAALSIEVRPNDRWSINFRHFSNAGSAVPNMGQDMLTVGYTFK